MKTLTLTSLALWALACSSPDDADKVGPSGPGGIDEIAKSVGSLPKTTTAARVDLDALTDRIDPNNPLGLLTDEVVVPRLTELGTVVYPPNPQYVPPPPCEFTNELELPLVTHYDGVTGGMKYLATDTPQLSCLGATIGALAEKVLHVGFIKDNPVFCDEWPTAPSYENYWGEDYALYTYPQAEIEGLFETACGLAGRGVRFLRPDALEAGRLETGSEEVQILHARQISGALASIYLPPGWDGEIEGGYAIFVTGGYDINSNVVGWHGQQMTGAVGTRPDVIGIVWNGGSTANSASGDERMRRQFDDIIDFVASTLGGDRHRVVITGGSRLGNIALSVAGNPDPHDYTVRYAQAVVPGMPKMLENEFAWAWGSSISAGFGGVGPYVGQPYAWAYDLDGWKYPEDGAPSLHGLNRYQATLHVLYGDSDADRVNAERRPYSDRFIDALLAAKTQVRLEISSHDFFMENKIQLEYARKLQARGVPVEVHYALRAGHRDLSGWAPALDALDALRVADTPTVAVGWNMEQTTLDEPFTRKPLHSHEGKLPFTLEHPRFTWRGSSAPLFIAAQPGTEWAVGLSRKGRFEHAFFGVTPAGETDVARFDVPSDAATGWYDVFAFVRYPGQASYSAVSGTPDCDDCTSDIYIGTSIPNHLKQSLFGAVMMLFTPRQFPVFPFTSWGVADSRDFGPPRK